MMLWTWILAAIPPGCSNNFFGFPPWYKYLEVERFRVDLADQRVCTPRLEGIGDIWLIGLAVIEILLRVAMLAAIFYIALAGVKYVNARGNAEKLSNAKNSLVDALVGLAIAIIATAVVNYIGRQFG